MNARTPNDAATIARLVASVNERLAAEGDRARGAGRRRDRDDPARGDRAGGAAAAGPRRRALAAGGAAVHAGGDRPAGTRAGTAARAATASCWRIRSAAPRCTATAGSCPRWREAGVLMSVTAGSLVGTLRRRGAPLRARAGARGADPQRHLRRPRQPSSARPGWRGAGAGRPRAAGRVAHAAGARSDPRRRADPARARATSGDRLRRDARGVCGADAQPQRRGETAQWLACSSHTPTLSCTWTWQCARAQATAAPSLGSTWQLVVHLGDDHPDAAATRRRARRANSAALGGPSGTLP